MAKSVAANKGIGNLMLVAYSRFEVPLALAGLLVTSVMGIGMYLIAEFIERRTTGWATRGADCHNTRHLTLTEHASPQSWSSTGWH
jgi:NitT/TauT family transport system permease protein